MKILVTGGSGFVGRNLIPKLLEEHHVVNLDIVPSDDTKLNSMVKTLIVDIRDFDSLKKTFESELKDIDVIIHLAALSREGEGNKFPEEYFQTNIVGTYNMLKLARESNVKKFIFASSFLAYGNQEVKTVNELQSLRPMTVYAATKAAGEALLTAFSEQYGFDHIIFRKCNLFGHRDPQKRVIDIWVERARSNDDIVLFGNKNLDFVSIEDVVNAYCSAVNFSGSDTFVIGSGKGNNLRSVAEYIIKLTNSKSRIIEKEPLRGRFDELCS